VQDADHRGGKVVKGIVIANCRLPIADRVADGRSLFPIGNGQSEIGNQQ
jgi:hypothetical protein